MLSLVPCLLIISFSPWISSQEMNMEPFLQFLRPESMSQMAQLASELSSLAVKNVNDNERNVLKTTEERKTINLANARPSEMFGQAISDIATNSRKMFVDALTPLEKPLKIQQLNVNQQQNAQSSQTQGNSFENQQLIRQPESGLPIRNLVRSIPNDSSERDVLGVNQPHRPRSVVRPLSEALASGEQIDALQEEEPIRRVQQNVNLQQTQQGSQSLSTVGDVRRKEQAQPITNSNNNNMFQALEQNPFVKLAESFLRPQQDSSSPSKNNNNELPQFRLNDFIPTADNNFGIPKGENCLPFIGEMMQAAYGDCVKVADEKTFDVWGEELRSAILQGKIDLMRASQETCKRGAERQQCGALKKAVSTCDVMGSLQIGTQLQRAIKRCEEMGGLMDQNPLTVLEQLNSLIGGEFGQGFLNRFLGNGQ